ncbi:Peptidyl-prolyl cis-trans isomerase FKBP2, partial [Stegodyphus mimosarum]
MKYILYTVFFACVLSSLIVLVTNEDNKATTKVKKLQIGVKKRIEGCEKKSKKGDILHMHYKGTLEDGTEFDNSYKRGEPLSFTLGSGQVIRGWDQGLLKMCEGEKRKLVIPPDLGYGSAGVPPTIPGDATLVFEVELVKIERKSEL